MVAASDFIVTGALLAELMEDLEKTHRKGIRYSIPAYLRYHPEVGFTIPLSDVFKPEELDKLVKRRNA